MLKIDLAGKVALVTGGSRGIGGSIAEHLALAGVKVFFTHTGRRSVAGLAGRIRDAGGTAEGIILDAANSAGTSKAVKEIVKKTGKIDILVCNAGRNLARRPEDIPDKEWREFLEINLSSAFYAVRAVLPFMEAAGYGRIIFIGSSAIYDGGGGAIDYAAGKAGITGMMTYLNKSYARKGILSNIIHPCVIETDLLKERYKTAEDKKKLIEQIPAGRLGRPEDIAGLVAYLASPYGDFICGQSILVDGGRTLWR